MIPTVITGLKALQCSICQMAGHRETNCWVNLALYEHCRATGNLEHNTRIRAALNLREETGALGFVSSSVRQFLHDEEMCMDDDQSAAVLSSRY